MRVAAAARGDVVVEQIVNGDLAAIGLPPTGLAEIGASINAGADGEAALRVAVWLAGAINRAGLSDAARQLYELSARRTAQKGPHVFRAPELAAREVARRALNYVASQEARELDGIANDDRE